MEESYDSHLTDTDEMSYLTCSMQLRVILSMWRLMFSSPLLTISCLLAPSHLSTLRNTWTSCRVTRSLLERTWTKNIIK